MVRIHDAEVVSSKQGMGLRCQMTLGTSEERSVVIKGCLAFRDKKQILRFLPPITKLRNKAGMPYNYHAVLLSPELADDIAASLETRYGHLLKNFDGPGTSGTPVENIEPGLTGEMEIE